MDPSANHGEYNGEKLDVDARFYCFYGGTLSSVQIFVPLGFSEQGFNEATLV